jgi:hypothetical protein
MRQARRTQDNDARRVVRGAENVEKGQIKTARLESRRPLQIQIQRQQRLRDMLQNPDADRQSGDWRSQDVQNQKRRLRRDTPNL